MPKYLVSPSSLGDPYVTFCESAGSAARNFVESTWKNPDLDKVALVSTRAAILPRFEWVFVYEYGDVKITVMEYRPE